VCETTSKNSNVKKQHKTPSLEQEATKLSKQENHYIKNHQDKNQQQNKMTKKKLGQAFACPIYIHGVWREHLYTHNYT
jgi:hypothetical protein